MAGYGDGSDGALSVSSGSQSLSLNHKYQFTSINIASGATLTTGDTTGAVMYLLCQGTCTISGTIDLHNIMAAGDNNWSCVIDGTTYSSPGVTLGGSGGNSTGGYNNAFIAYGGRQGSGFGGGGAGGGTTYGASGNGGDGGTPGGSGGASVSATVTSSSSNLSGNNGSTSAGGSGRLFIQTSFTGSGSSGAGGNAYGSNGGNASAPTGTSVALIAGGGGGAGGAAGRAGIHLVIKADKIVFTGAINTSGTNGGDGGIGGNGYNNSTGAYAKSGANGGGGGGGNGGDVYLISDNTSVNGTTILTGGSGGSNHTSAKSGSDGTSGTLYLTTPVFVDDNRLLFLSSWDIDQLVKTDIVTISGSGDTVLIDYSSLNIPANPIFEVQFKPSGASAYYMSGLNSTDGTTTNEFSFYSYTSGSKLYIHTSGTGTARYFLWSDKVDYQ